MNHTLFFNKRFLVYIVFALAITMIFAPEAAVAQEAPTIEPCVGVDAVKSTIDSALLAFKNFAVYVLGAMAIVVFVVGLIMTFADKGGKWFKRGAIIAAGLLFLNAVIYLVLRLVETPCV